MKTTTTTTTTSTTTTLPKGSANACKLKIKFVSSLLTFIGQKKIFFFGFLLQTKLANPYLLFHLFSVFSNKHHYDFDTKSTWKMSCPSSIQCQDSNSRPLEHESSPITTRPRLLPLLWYFIIEITILLWTKVSFIPIVQTWKLCWLGSGCESVGRAVASDTISRSAVRFKSLSNIKSYADHLNKIGKLLLSVTGKPIYTSWDLKIKVIISKIFTQSWFNSS